MTRPVFVWLFQFRPKQSILLKHDRSNQRFKDIILLSLLKFLLSLEKEKNRTEVKREREKRGAGEKI